MRSEAHPAFGAPPLPPDIAQLGHAHVFLGSDHDGNARRTGWVVGLTAVMMVAEILAGLWTGSMALLADGLHMATHAGALGMAALAYVYARRHATDPAFSFGTGKVGELAGFASALVLGIVALGIAVESVLRLMEPAEVAFAEAAGIAALGLAVNIVSALILGGGHGHGHTHGHAHGHGSHTHVHHAHPKAGGDSNLRSAYAHVLADALTSVLAIAALLGARHFGWTWLDPAVGLLGSVMIGRWAVALLRESGGVLLDMTDTGVAAEIRTLVETPGDAHLVDLHVWRIGPQAHAAIVSVAAPEGLGPDTIRARLHPVHELRHLTVEMHGITRRGDAGKAGLR